MDFPTGRKDNWHKQRMITKQKFSKQSRPAIVNKTKNKTNSNRDAPTTVIDVADSSDDRFSKRSISSASASASTSASIYDEKFNSDSDEGLDFEIALKTPIGEDFKFSSEKNWENTDNTFEKCEFGEFFTINWKLLKAGIDTIPFYRVMDMDSSLFTNEELKEMNSKAEMNEKIYHDLLKEHENNLLKKQNDHNPSSSESRKSSATKKRQKSGKKSTDNNQIKIDDKENLDIELQTQQNDNKKIGNDEQLDELLNMTTENLENIKIEEETIDNDKNTKENEVNLSDDENKKVEVKEAIPVNPENNKKEDIQEWLDGILDE